MSTLFAPLQVDTKSRYLDALTQVQDNSSSSEGSATLRIVDTKTDHKRIPSKLFIEVFYGNDELYISAPNKELIVELTITNCWSGEIIIIPNLSPEELISIHLDSGEYEVIAHQLNGYTYKGIMDVC